MVGTSILSLQLASSPSDAEGRVPEAVAAEAVALPCDAIIPAEMRGSGGINRGRDPLTLSYYDPPAITRRWSKTQSPGQIDQWLALNR